MDDPWIAAAAGVVVAAISAAIAWLGLRYSARHPRLLLAAVLGGTMVRLVLVAAVSILLLWTTDVHHSGYVGGLVVAYLVFLGVEIAYVARTASRRDGADEGE